MKKVPLDAEDGAAASMGAGDADVMQVIFPDSVVLDVRKDTSTDSSEQSAGKISVDAWLG